MELSILAMCEKMRFSVIPDVKIGVITLQRKRPWPSCPNPETGNEWSDDMRKEIVKILEKSPFEVIYVPKDIQVVDDRSLRKALGMHDCLYLIHGFNRLNLIHFTVLAP